MSGEPYSLARTLLLIKVFSDEMHRRRKEDLSAEAVRLMPPGTRLPVIIDGRNVGWVSMPKPTTKAVVTDERRLLAFVKERFPSEVQTVEQVRPAFLSALKASAKEHGGWLDNGEIVTVPGLSVETEAPVPRATPEDGAFEAVIEARRSGELDELLPGLLEIESGES